MALLAIMIFIWVFLTGELTWGNVGFAAILSIILLYLTRTSEENQRFIRIKRNQNVFKYILVLLRFVGFFFKELILAGFSVFKLILVPAKIRPGVVAVPLDIKSDAEITLLANLITLTPGTLTLDVSTDKKVIYVHAIQMKDANSFRAEIKNGFESTLL